MTALILFVAPWLSVGVFIQNRSLYRRILVLGFMVGFPSALIVLSASCRQPCLDVARYAFGKDGSQSA